MLETTNDHEDHQEWQSPPEVMKAAKGGEGYQGH